MEKSPFFFENYKIMLRLTVEAKSALFRENGIFFQRFCSVCIAQNSQLQKPRQINKLTINIFPSRKKGKVLIYQTFSDYSYI